MFILEEGNCNNDSDTNHSEPIVERASIRESEEEDLTNSIYSSFLGSNVVNIRKASISSESELPYTSTSESEDESPFRKGNLFELAGVPVVKM